MLTIKFVIIITIKFNNGFNSMSLGKRPKSFIFNES